MCGVPFSVGLWVLACNGFFFVVIVIIATV